MWHVEGDGLPPTAEDTETDMVDITTTGMTTVVADTVDTAAVVMAVVVDMAEEEEEEDITTITMVGVVVRAPSISID
jgi:hypothetical protein